MKKIADFISHFGFHTTPLTCEIAVLQHFVNEPYSEALLHLYRAVDKRRSAAARIAPVGTCKTTVLRTLVSRLPKTRYHVCYIKVTDLSKRDLCQVIAAVAGAEPTCNHPTLVRRLQDRFSAFFDIDGLRPVLLLYEAHDICLEVLGILRIPTNFNIDSRLLSSVILSGQSPLVKLLSHARLKDVARRLAHYAALRMLSRCEIKPYIEHHSYCRPL